MKQLFLFLRFEIYNEMMINLKLATFRIRSKHFELEARNITSTNLVLAMKKEQ